MVIDVKCASDQVCCNESFTISFDQPKVFKALVSVLSSLQSEIRILINEKGMFSSFMDGSHIGLFALCIPKEDLIIEGMIGNSVIGLNVEDVFKCLARIGEGPITLKHDKSKKTIDMIIDVGNGKTKKFTISLIDLDTEEVNLASLQALPYDNQVEFGYGDLDSILKDCAILSSVVQLKVSRERSGARIVQWSTEGAKGNFEQVFNNLSIDEYHNDSENSYAIPFLQTWLKSSELCGCSKQSKKAKEATFFFETKSESPIKLTARFLQNSSLVMWLSPRVEEETDTMVEEEEKPKTPTKEELAKKEKEGKIQALRDQEKALGQEIQDKTELIEKLKKESIGYLSENKMEEGYDCINRMKGLQSELKNNNETFKQLVKDIGEVLVELSRT